MRTSDLRDEVCEQPADIGSHYPALISASGRCLAAFGGHLWPEIERRFRALRWDDPPTLPPPAPDASVLR